MLIPPLAFLGSLGGQELLIILVLVVFLFGAKKLPAMARGLGESVRELRKASRELEAGDDERDK